VVVRYCAEGGVERELVLRRDQARELVGRTRIIARPGRIASADSRSLGAASAQLAESRTELPPSDHDRSPATKRSLGDETNCARLIEAIALLDQALEESPATKNCWVNRNRLLDAIALLEKVLLKTQGPKN